MKLTLVSVFLFLTACSTLVPGFKSFTVPYIEPEGGTTTRVQVITDEIVKLMPDRSCIDWNAPGTGIVAARSFGPGNDKTLNDRKLGMPSNGDIKKVSEVYVKSGAPLVIIYNAGGCEIAATFISEPNTDYQILSGINRGSCTMALSKIARDNSTGKVVYLPVKLEKAKRCDN